MYWYDYITIKKDLIKKINKNFIGQTEFFQNDKKIFEYDFIS